MTPESNTDSSTPAGEITVPRGFTIERRGGVSVVVWSENGCRPASVPEEVLWDEVAALHARIESYQDATAKHTKTIAALRAERDDWKQQAEGVNADLLDALAEIERMRPVVEAHEAMESKRNLKPTCTCLACRAYRATSEQETTDA